MRVSILFALVAPLALAAERRVLEFDFYRATPARGINAWTIQNFNLASLAGVTKYVHTEVIAESVVGNHERLERKYGIDAIMKMRVKVKNPDKVLLRDGKLAKQVDFGPFVTFDKGEATNPQSQLWIQEYGSYVGVQQQVDVRWAYTEPYFWFSVTGWCPNLPYYSIPKTQDVSTALRSERSAICGRHFTREACAADSDICVFDNYVCVARDPVPECLNYTSSSGEVGHVRSGLCQNGEGNLAIDPTGAPDCTYSYGDVTQVNFDETVGILNEDCGGRRCTDWLDFRRSCSNLAYRRKFNTATKLVESFAYCVEYDVHPDCERGCDTEACQRVPPDERELGLPFWRGKCNSRANERRVEAIGEAFGMALAATKHIVTGTSNLDASCIRQSPGPCVPAPGQGGNYCTREWAGVCTNCFIPGTKSKWLDDKMPHCPYDILSTSDYAGAFEAPRCKSTKPSDLCCLYTGTCDLRYVSALDAPLDEDGFALVASWGNTTAMGVFLERAAKRSGLGVDAGALAPFAYSQWARSPRKDASWSRVLEELATIEVALTTRPPTAFDIAVRHTGDAKPVEKQESTSSLFLASGATIGIGLMIALAVLLVLTKRGILTRSFWFRSSAPPPERPPTPSQVRSSSKSSNKSSSEATTAPTGEELSSATGSTSEVICEVPAMLPRIGLRGASPEREFFKPGCDLRDVDWVKSLTKSGVEAQAQASEPVANEDLERGALCDHATSSTGSGNQETSRDTEDQMEPGAGSDGSPDCSDVGSEDVELDTFRGTPPCMLTALQSHREQYSHRSLHSYREHSASGSTAVSATTIMEVEPSASDEEECICGASVLP